MPAHPNVLVVDDEATTLRALSVLLARQGYDVRTAARAREALQILEREPVQVVISDENMPEMSGGEFLSIVRRRFPNTVRIVLSGCASFDSAVRSINEADVFRYLTKPYQSETLLAAVASALDALARDALGNQLLAVVEQARGLTATSPPQPAAGQAPPASGPASGFPEEKLRRLSGREQEILSLLSDGRRVSQIAATLCLSVHTVRNHLKAIFRKLDVHSQAEIMRQSRR
jgi:two-component system, probable response regulator PhcQ